ncbi:hypothetical protein DL766_002055 [Monosporascus sp. MC13-8B]|uniref:Nudix hydrolase domain-containing protein n=1 Tax=Monosporascus cannonballus TaxID=155416 RepID=A0ABY0HH07_9PEZI|nr:hypothetical protein DL763_006275 [Monosporascus cannonballus]RYO91274.1 hypothetical protein DL762_002260 [Monosporascus cannonballus]RYP36393.1 hypothetical protein DL766_002055 [Monosporascus sp. MC13-8B]
MSDAVNSGCSDETTPGTAVLEKPDVIQTVSSSTTTTSTTLPADLALVLDSQEEQQYPAASYYWDASTMGPLNAVSAAAIARLRAYKPPPFPTWDRLHVSRRAAVLVLLFADRRGDLRVVITMRAASLRSFSGHAAFPGGKADSPLETPYQIARREAWEEIGLPMDDAKIPKPFRIEPLCSLPCNLARTDLVARPCVAFLHADNHDSSDGSRPALTVDEGMIPRLDAKEVAAVFSAPFHNFLNARDEEPSGLPGNDGGEGKEVAPALPPGDWYDGYWVQVHGQPWRVHNFHVPVDNQRVTRPRRREGGQAVLADETDEQQEAAQPQRFLVWGFTGRILVDAARIAYAEEPEFEHNAHLGDEEMIRRLEAEGQLPEKRRTREVGVEATREVVNETKI